MIYASKEKNNRFLWDHLLFSAIFSAVLFLSSLLIPTLNLIAEEPNPSINTSVDKKTLDENILDANVTGQPKPLIKNKYTRFTNRNIDSGFSQTTISDIVQDDLGFAWIATQYGLNRFDGRDVVQFYSNDTGKGKLSSNYINSLKKDGQGNIWVLTSSGLDSVDVASFEITNWKSLISDFVAVKFPEMSKEFSIENFDISNDDQAFIEINNKHLIKLDIKSGRFSLLSNAIGSEKKIKNVTALDDGSIFLIGTKCFIFYNMEADSSEELCEPKKFSDMHFQTVYSNAGKVIIGYNQGFLVIDNDTKNYEIIEVVDSKTKGFAAVYSLFYHDNGYWLGTSLGLKFYDVSKRAITQEYFYDATDSYSLSSDSVRTIYQTSDKLIWFGTTYGISILDTKQQFAHLLRRKETQGNNLNNLTTSILEDASGQLWIGTSTSGLYKYSSNRGLLSNQVAVKFNKQNVFLGYVSKLASDNNNNVWMLSEAGLSYKAIDDEEFTTHLEFKASGKTFRFDYAYDFIFDRYGDIWIGGTDGLAKVKVEYDELGKVASARFSGEILNKHLPVAVLSSNYPVHSIMQDLRGYIWIGSANGVVKLSSVDYSAEYFTHDPNDPKSLSDPETNYIYEDMNGSIWIATSSGLNRVYFDEYSGTKFEHYGTKDGFSSDYICAIESDVSGNLWISTLKGLTRFYPGSNANVANFSHKNGLQHNEFYVKSVFKSNSGKLYFGGVNGVSKFNPNDIVFKQSEDKLSFSRIEQQKNSFPIERSSKIEIALNSDKPLDIYLTDFDFNARENMSLRYRFLGDDSDWVETDNQKIRFHNIDKERSIIIQHKEVSENWYEPGVVLKVFPQKNFFTNNMIWAIFSTLLVLFFLAILYRNARKLKNIHDVNTKRLQKERAKQNLLMSEKNSMLHQIEDLQFSLSEQKFLVDKVQTKIQQQQVYDELTGLYNRSFIRKNIQQELAIIENSWEQPGLQEGVYLGIFSVEVDNFLSIRERHGHLSSNEILKQVSKSLRDICYGTDILVRWEGATIVIFSRGISRREQMMLAEKMRNIIASRKFDLSNGKKIDVTISIGFTRYPFYSPNTASRQLDWSKINYIAETALSVAQMNSLNAWVGIFSNEFSEPLAIEEHLIGGMSKMIKSGQLDYFSSIPKSKKLHWE